MVLLITLWSKCALVVGCFETLFLVTFAKSPTPSPPTPSHTLFRRRLLCQSTAPPPGLLLPSSPESILRKDQISPRNLLSLETNNLMAGLISAHITPTRISYCHHLSYSVVDSHCLPRRFFKLSIGMTGHSGPLKLVASSAKAPVHGNTKPTKEVLEVWRNAAAVCFDVDSTVCLDEGIDELAEFCGAGKAVAEWTAKAMSGSIPFEEALAARLSLFNPSLFQLQEFLEKRPPRLSPGIMALVDKLKARGTEVYLISGGFRQMIEPVAAQLGVPLGNIFANKLLFERSGEFYGFDKMEPTSRSGGKAIAVQNIRKAREYSKLVMIGDGATDLEARKPGGADLFICYAGVQLRDKVAANADWLVFDFQDLILSLK